jgi:Holliday junction resolvase RusA-like endonuclease
MKIEFLVPGEPVAKGRARSLIRAGHIKHMTPEKTANYESLVALAAQAAMIGAGLRPFEGPVQLSFYAVFSIPKSWSKKRLAAHAVTPELVCKKPDLDNIMKALSDGMNRVVYVDDSQIATVHGRKGYGAVPGVRVVVSPTTETGAAK